MRWPNRSIRERFEEKFSPVPFSGCWLWTARVNECGYGTFGLSTTVPSVLAHRMAWTLYVDKIPEGMLVCHRCDVPCCVNPNHLFLGSNKDNVHDAMAKGRYPQQWITHCTYGHEFTTENTILRKNGSRACRECSRFHWRNYARKKRWEVKSRSSL